MLANRTPPRRNLALLATLLMVGACGPHRLAVVAPVADPAAEAEALMERTRLDTSLQIRFAWSSVETNMRAGGRGVARVEPPDRARLDLFLSNGETVLRAALVDGAYRLPPGTDRRFLPPPDLMWGALGVFRPGPRARLVGGDLLENGALRLRYAYDDVELHYETRNGVLTRVDVLDGEELVQWVTLVPDTTGARPLEARFRDQVEVRELRLVRESLERVTGFPAEIWSPSR